MNEEAGLALGGTKSKSTQALERDLRKYQRKVDNKTTSPSQRNYAMSMLRMTQAAIKDSQEDGPAREIDGATVVDLHPDEWSSKPSHG